MYCFESRASCPACTGAFTRDISLAYCIGRRLVLVLVLVLVFFLWCEYPDDHGFVYALLGELSRSEALVADWPGIVFCRLFLSFVVWFCRRT